jgi:hypothetical protein
LETNVRVAALAVVDALDTKALIMLNVVKRENNSSSVPVLNMDLIARATRFGRFGQFESEKRVVVVDFYGSRSYLWKQGRKLTLKTSGTCRHKLWQRSR